MALLLNSLEQLFILRWKSMVNVVVSAKTLKEAYLLAGPAAAVYSGIQRVIPPLRTFYKGIRWRLALSCDVHVRPLFRVRTRLATSAHLEEVLLVPRRWSMRTLRPTLAQVLLLLDRGAAEEGRKRE